MIEETGTITAAAAGAPDVSEPEPALRACLFRIEGALFAVDVRSAREVVAFDHVTVVPRAPRCLLGVANLRGAIMPIVDIRPLIGLSVDRRAAGITGLVIEDASIQAAVAIEAAIGLEPFADVISGRDRKECVLGFLSRGDEIATLVDARKILRTLALEMGRMS
jgi:chemotaxis signal transduction protein